MIDMETHPCFTSTCTHYARIHLPVAPKCNMQCNYCLRKYSCVNESRPGVTTKIMLPDEAVASYQKVKKVISDISVIGIAGPGDALANWENVRETLNLVRKTDTSVKFCLSTNGLLLPLYVDELAALGVRYITVTVNCINKKLAAHIYDYVDYEGKRYRGESAGNLLQQQQLLGIKMARNHNMHIKINSVAIADVNVQHLLEVAKMAAGLQCDVMNIIPMIPVKGSKFGTLRETTKEEIYNIRKQCGYYIRQMFHCRHCRADAVGRL